ncbi:hypothetical protein PAXRUDRAFT_15586 [Paxillus rubicundulus Ve08.2h10]|uniref:Uncharacterized protein n=1 Tax=Paxillus rubicundulus Ve08.2h10 TaxID=930991 RepID=A0A0D0DPE7_9AGAM|nr:hypothetical protein PAXRUDRAFT_15586 [Paxillus rubicundulus Ve08.2h10]
MVANNQSLNVIECLKFRCLLLLQDELWDQDIPRWTKLQIEIIAVWQEYLVTLKKDMDKALGNMSFTANIWGDKVLQPYLAMTGHSSAN